MAIDADLVDGAVVACIRQVKKTAGIQRATTGAQTMNPGIHYFAYTALAAASTVTGPPNASLVPGQKISIKDETGNANTYNITFAPASGNIDGSATKAVVSSAYGCVHVYFDGTNWWTVS